MVLALLMLLSISLIVHASRPGKRGLRGKTAILLVTFIQVVIVAIFLLTAQVPIAE